MVNCMERQTLQEHPPVYHVCQQCAGQGCAACSDLCILDGDFDELGPDFTDIDLADWVDETGALSCESQSPINRVIGINPSPYQRCFADYYLDQLSRTRRCYAHKYESQDAFLPLSLQQAFHEELSPAQEWCKFGFRHSAHPCYHEYSWPCVYPLFELYAPYGYWGFRLQNNLMVIKKHQVRDTPYPVAVSSM